MDVKNFPEALRLSRKLKDWSQEQVAVEVGASQQTVAGWERGRSMPRRDAYAKLVEIFGAESLVAKFPPSEDDISPLIKARYGLLNEPVRVTALPTAAEPRNNYAHNQTFMVPPDQRAVVNGIRSAIPEKLIPALGITLAYRDHYYFATYQSDRVCLVCLQYRLAATPTYTSTMPIRKETEKPDRYRMLVRSAVRRTTREAIRQLVILRAINKLAGSDERTYIATVTPLDTTIGLDGLMPPQIEDEAYLLNLRCYHATTPAVVASIIASHEEPEQIGVDYSDDFIDGQAS